MMQGYPIGLLAVDRLVDSTTWHSWGRIEDSRKKLEAVSSCCYHGCKLHQALCLLLLSAATHRMIDSHNSNDQEANQPATIDQQPATSNEPCKASCNS